MSIFSNFGKWFNSKYCSNKKKRHKIANLMRKLGVEPYLIVYMDGGLCSQINQFAIGQYFLEKGYKVLYDCTFFEKNGKDLDGRFDRNYQLDKFLEINNNQINKIYNRKTNISLYLYKRLFFNAFNTEPNNIASFINDSYCPPIYLNNYYYFDPLIFKSSFKKYIHLKKTEEILDYDNQKIAYKIINTDSVGIHVRLGDLAKPQLGYSVVTLDYYLRAINLPELKNKELFFFSEEPEWIEKNILPNIDSNIKTNIIRNPSNEGYKDLLLLSLCKNIIASQGTFGLYSYLFNNNSNKILILPDFPVLKGFEKYHNYYGKIFQDDYVIKIKP